MPVKVTSSDVDDIAIHYYTCEEDPYEVSLDGSTLTLKYLNENLSQSTDSFQEAPKLMPYAFDINMYDVIILGTPIWASTFAPPLRTFIRAHSWEGRKVALFACCSGGGTEKCFQQMYHETRGSIRLSVLRLIDPLRNASPEQDTVIAGFCEEISRNTLIASE